MLLEHLDVHVGRHGCVRVRLGDREWMVRHRQEAEAPACGACELAAPGRFIYHAAGVAFCRRCARAAMHRTGI